jgi:hypothetical protein
MRATAIVCVSVSALLQVDCRSSPDPTRGGKFLGTSAAGAAPQNPTDLGERRSVVPESSGATPKSGGGRAGPSANTSASRPQTVDWAMPSIEVKDCAPCELQPAQGLRYEVRFAPAAKQNVTQLEVKSLTQNNASPQIFKVEYGWSPSGDFVLEGVDLNFDGVLDLAFGPVSDTPNETLQYWLIDPQGGPLESLGSFPNLKVDAKAHEIRTYEKGGHAGLLHEAKTYRWEGGNLIVIEIVTQTQDPGQNGYRETTRKFKSGRVVDEKTRRVAAP